MQQLALRLLRRDVSEKLCKRRLVAIIDSNDFIHSESTLSHHVYFPWTNDPAAGPELRVGESSYTETNSFYDGGSDDPENLAKIIFVEIVFDHNAASSLGGAVDINGRGSHPGGPNPETQTWESGIEVTISGCTFYRNYATYAYGAVNVFDIWP